MRQQLNEMESRAGRPDVADGPDRVDAASDLVQAVEQSLRPSEALLSFHLDAPHSYVWTVTRGGFSFEPIAPGPELRALIGDFREALGRDDAAAAGLGARLYQELFSRAGRRAEAKRDWLVAVDGALLDAPLASLVSRRAWTGRCSWWSGTR